MTLLFKIVKTELLTQDTLDLLLRPERPFAFEAGDYIKMGVQETDLKPFSIANSPRQDGLIELHIKDHDHSEFMKNLFSLEAGDELLVDGPHKQYQLDKDICKTGQTIILIAGGTGFSPMKALLDELLETDCTNPIEFYWGARHTEDFYHRNTLLSLAEHHTNLSYIEVLSEDSSTGNQRKGMVHKEVLKDHPSLEKIRVYLCGPWPMVAAAKQDFLEAGLKESCFN